jgi:magnesium transporter
MADGLKDRQLLWIDVGERTDSTLDPVGAALCLDAPQIARLVRPPERVDLTQYADHIHLVMEAMESPSRDSQAPGKAPQRAPERRMVDIVAGRNWVLTVHDGPLDAVDRMDASTKGETRLGALDAGGFVAGIVDEILAGYFAITEGIEREIDELDERALRARHDKDLLPAIVAVRRRAGLIRRTLAPHRGPFAALARPEMELHEELGPPWPGLIERLERAIDAAENLRDVLLGTFDIHMGRAAQEANEVMKVLTLLSAVLLPSVVLAGVMGMNFPLPFFEQTTHFWWVIVAMIAFALGMFAIARWRRWL